MHHKATLDERNSARISASDAREVPEAADAVRRPGRAKTILALFCVSALTAVGVTHAIAEPRLTQEQTARIQDICSDTMRLRPGEVHFDACVSALSDSFALRLGVHTIKANRASCEQIGLQPDTTEFDVCVAKLENRQDSATRNTVQAVSAVARGEILPAEPVSAEGAGAPASDAHSPPVTRFARARLSCAELGLDPQSSAFGVCAANLDSALFALDHEPN